MTIMVSRKQGDKRGWLWRRGSENEPWTKVFASLKASELRLYRDDKVRLAYHREFRLASSWSNQQLWRTACSAYCKQPRSSSQARFSFAREIDRRRSDLPLVFEGSSEKTLRHCKQLLACQTDGSVFWTAVTQATQPLEVLGLLGSTVQESGAEEGRPPGHSSRIINIQVCSHESARCLSL